MSDTATRDRLLVEREGLVKDWEARTVEWIHGAGQSGFDAEVLKKKRNEIASSLRDGYWTLDPYVRAKGIYDRCGLINPGGKLQFYPGEKEKLAGAAGVETAAPAVETTADDID